MIQFFIPFHKLISSINRIQDSNVKSQQYGKSDDRNRVEWIDAAKGLAIFTVILGHIVTPLSPMESFISSFHMPLFFILAGIFTLNRVSDESFSTHVVKRLNRLFIPYIFYGTLFLIPFNWIYFHFIIPSAQTPILQRILAHLLGLHSDWGEEWRCFLWFFPCLLISDIMLWSATKYSPRFKTTIVLAIFFAGVFYATFYNWSLPLRFHTSLIAILFLFIGSYLFKLDNLTKPKYIHIMLLIYGVLWYLNEFSGLNMSDNYYGKIVYSIPASIFGSILIITITKWKIHHRLFRLLGKHSLLIYILHQPFVPFVLAASSKLKLNENLWVETISMTIVAMAIAIICTCISQAIHKYMPWSVGLKSVQETTLPIKQLQL